MKRFSARKFVKISGDFLKKILVNFLSERTSQKNFAKKVQNERRMQMQKNLYASFYFRFVVEFEIQFK